MQENFKKYDETAVVSYVLKEMSIGDVAEFPISRMVTVRVSSCNIGLMDNKKFKTRTDKVSRTITVSRIA